MLNPDAAPDPGISVIVPIYNSEASLPELIARLEPVLRDLGEPFEAWLVNDGSYDGSWTVVVQLAQRHDWLYGINLMRNYGQHNALLCGIRAARYDITVTLDDDLQHPPEEIPKLLEKLAAGHDVVYGTPRDLPHSRWRNLTSTLTKRLFAYVTGVAAIRDVNAFRAFRTDLRRAFAGFHGPQLLIDVLLSWATTRFASVRVEHRPRRSGQSNYNVRRLCNQALLLMTGFSTLPLRLASLVGFAFTLFGMVVLTYVVSIYLLKGSLPGFPFLGSIIAIFSGAQLFALGIFGEYLARIFNRSLDRPTYVVKAAIGDQIASEAGSPQQVEAGRCGSCSSAARQ
jgi:glycosyltransferase involved in cell wall biosynthesis